MRDITSTTSPPAIHEKTAAPSTVTLRELPTPRGLPWVGHAHQIDVTRLHLQLEDWARELGDLYTLRMFGRRTLVVADAALMQHALQNRPHDYRRWAAIESVSRELAAEGLFSAEGEDWKRQRKLVLPAFSMRQQRTMFPMLMVHVERLRRRWSGAAIAGRAVDVRADIMRFTVDVTCSLVLACDFNTIEGNRSELRDQMSGFFTMFNERINAPFAYWRWLKLPRDHALDRSRRELEQLLQELIVAARAALATDPVRAVNPNTLLDAMLIAQHDAPSTEAMSDADISGNLLTLLLAGEDTTSNSLAWMLHHIASEPGVQLQLQAETDALLGKRSIMSYEDIAQLRFGAAVVHETLRLRSPAPVMFIEAARDVVLGNVLLPKGTKLLLLSRYAATCSSNFSEPHMFRPQRWIDAPAASTCPMHRTRAQLAFGAGPRTCPGRSLALFESSLVLSMLARHFTISHADPGARVTEVFDFTMQPRGLQVLFRSRSVE